MRRKVVFDKGRGWREQDERFERMRMAGDPGAEVGEYRPQESSEVTLTGHVGDRQTKWRAEDLVESCRGVNAVHNRLRVER